MNYCNTVTINGQPTNTRIKKGLRTFVYKPSLKYNSRTKYELRALYNPLPINAMQKSV